MSASLPDLSEHYPITSEQIQQYQCDGHILLRNVASQEEVNAYRPYIEKVVAQLNQPNRPIEERYYYGNALQQTMNSWRRDNILRDFVVAKRFAKIAADLMQVDRIRLNHDCVLFKEPGAQRTPFHQDQQVWPLDTSNTISMWMPLCDISEDMGTMIFFSGSHKWGDITLKATSVVKHAIREKVPEVCYGAMKAGDAIFHSGWVFHGANENQTNQIRKISTIIYYEDGACIVDPLGDFNRERHLKRYFPGLCPGDLAITPINPLLFER